MTTERHRGAHPADARLFGTDQLPALRSAVGDLSWLLGRGYSDVAANKLVGDHHQLARRQRAAIFRCSVGQGAVDARLASEVQEIRGEDVIVDGFNAVITLERLLSGGIVLRGMDGVLRDLAGVHGTWRRRIETDAAIALLVAALGTARSVELLLDQPVSNSGRLAGRVRLAAPTWDVRLDPKPDPVLAASDKIVVSGDGWILENCARWFNLLGRLSVPGAWVVDLRPGRG